MNEEFLHYIWKFRLFDFQDLKLTSGEDLQILSPGTANSDAGPDFLNGKIAIDSTQWAGNIEIHVRSSEWLQHMHQLDKAYDNVILHVVYENDKEILRKNGEVIPCLELKGRINLQLYSKYRYLLHNHNWIPCQQQITDVDEFVREHWLERMLVERLEEKTTIIAATLQLNNNNWEETFYQTLARYFGMKVNSAPFEMLARSLPSNILAKHKSNLLQLEALLFGQAGFLEDIFSEKYPQQLQKEYQFFRKKYGLMPIGKHLWKFLRLRPANFPTIRIAQFASLVHQSSHLFSKIFEAKNIKELEQLFNAEVSEYWVEHYNFNKPASRKSKKLGRSGIHLLIINVVVPFLFFYGKNRSHPEFQERAMDYLSALPSEKNNIITHWNEIGMNSKNAFESQALLQLYNQYCHPKKCLKCNIGNHILKKS